MAVKNILGGKKDEYPWKKEEGMGTTGGAEYSESGPFSCQRCWYLVSLEPRENSQGLCAEPHMLRDPETEKVSVDGKNFAVVNKFFGCCRYIDVVAAGEPKKKFIFQGNPTEEAEEHEELNESPSEEDVESLLEDEDEGEESE